MTCRFRLPVFVLLGVLIGAGCASTKEAARPAVEGQWNYTMRNPSQGTISGVISFYQGEEGDWTGRVTVREMGINEAMTIRNVEIDGNAFTLTGSAANSDFTISGVVDGDTITGKNDVVGVGVFELEATRQTE